ncbi:sensor histidine kinase [Streptococcus ferus]|uniref:histidine kinase n=1 Tax=Streptococcus ferus TaxID=1345 RepID=A0A2X3VFW1_9STRE|nr:sensor histidine kinase [Streptococcus ferus]SQF40360.1 histidine kinase [Streptococcus ferus]
MIKAFFKEYGAWYLLYGLLSLLFFLTFYLYRLPLVYFQTSFIFVSTILILLSLGLYYRFYQKMTSLHFFLAVTNLDNLNQLEQPSDKAYQKIIAALIQKEAEAALVYQSDQDKIQQMIKLWSHQMKIPLATLSLMEQTNQLEKESVRQQILRLENNLSRLMNYIKFNQNQSDFRFESVSMRDILVDLVKKNQVLYRQKDLSLTIEGDWILKSDKKWLSFSLAQILDNAIKYNKPGGKVSIRIQDKSVCIQDTGIGILAEDIPRIFEEGFTGYNGHEHQKATGLGLYMTKQILNHLEFDISIQSQVDQGTKVLIRKR